MAIVIRRGATPRITTHIPDDIDMSEITNVWIYISQSEGCQNVVKVDKGITDVQIDPDEKTISVKLTQEDTIALKVGTGTIQIRLLLSNGDCLPSSEGTVRVLSLYKEGVMTDEN